MGAAPQDAICAECAAPPYLGAKLPRAASGYAVCVVSLATGILALSLREWQTGEWPQLGALVILAMAAWSLKITLPRSTYQLSATYMVSMVGVMMLGLPQTLLLGDVPRHVAGNPAAGTAACHGSGILFDEHTVRGGHGGLD